MIDCDPQASATAIFGYVPEADIPPDETLLPFLEGDVDDLSTAVRSTYFAGVDLVPANLDLYRAEYTLAAGPVDLGRLKDGIASVWGNYDVIVIDPPPSLGLISLNALYAANAMVIPMSQGLLDFYSTVSFVQMLRDTIEIIESRVGEIQTKFVKVLMTRVDEAKPVHGELARLLEDTFGNYLLKSRMRDSAAVDNAGMMMRTVWSRERMLTVRRFSARATSSTTSTKRFWSFAA